MKVRKLSSRWYWCFAVLAAFGIVGWLTSRSQSKVTNTPFEVTQMQTRAHFENQAEKQTSVQTEGRSRKADLNRSGLPSREATAQKALAKFNMHLNKISRDDLEKEYERVLAALKEARHKEKEIIVPVRESIEGRNGKWVKLTYPNGEVRYDFPPE